MGKGDGDEFEDLRSRARRAGAERNIEFAGFVSREKIPDYYRSADVFCSPASYEGGVANVYLEAMACGCPLVASTAGGAPEAVSHGHAGMLVAPGDAVTAAAAIDEILTRPDLRRSMGQMARERVEAYFAMDKYIQRVLATVSDRFLSQPANGDEVRARYGLQGKRTIGFVGSFQHWHDVPGLMEAFHLLHIKDPDVRLLLVGDGLERERCQRIARDLGLAEAVVFTGGVPHAQVPDHMAANGRGDRPLPQGG